MPNLNTTAFLIIVFGVFLKMSIFGVTSFQQMTAALLSVPRNSTGSSNGGDTGFLIRDPFAQLYLDVPLFQISVPFNLPV